MSSYLNWIGFFVCNQINYSIIYFLGNRSWSIDENRKKYEKLSENESDKQQAKHTHKSISDCVRGIINPFDKSQYFVKLTSNRRRWSHTFPESKQITTFYNYNYNLL